MGLLWFIQSITSFFARLQPLFGLLNCVLPQACGVDLASSLVLVKIGSSGSKIDGIKWFPGSIHFGLGLLHFLFNQMSILFLLSHCDLDKLTI